MSWHTKKTYVGGKVVHPRGGGILLEPKAPVKEVLKSALTSPALERLEALRPREISTPKRQNIRF